MSDLRPTISAPPGGWGHPWPNVAEIESVLSHEVWTLIGGLMVQLHALHHGVASVRPTNDVDIVVHVETGRGRPTRIADALKGFGYEIQSPLDPRTSIAHGFKRGGDTVDVVVADHAAPSVIERIAGHDMVLIEGGTQALRRTVNAKLASATDSPTTVSVPDPYGALILKAAAHRTDTRDRERHLLDAAVLLACITDPFAELEREPSGSDRSRVLHLREHLADPLHVAWLQRDAGQRADAQATLGILTKS